MTATTSPARSRRVKILPARVPSATRPAGLFWVVASEGLAGALGFVALVYQARVLGPPAFARLEFAAGVAAWMLVLVRGGFDVIVYREAARNPRLVGPLTDLLIGLRCVAAVAGYAVVLAVAASLGTGRGGVVAVAGLSLFASSWVADVGPRASGRLGWVALGQAVRSFGLAAAVFGLVRGSGDAVRGAACLVVAETVGAAVMVAVHARDYGFPRAVWRSRACLVLARRGAIAGVTRFGRVTLYGADILALGWWLAGDLGPYAAARRVVFALAALGLVVPAMLGPTLARAWAVGERDARDRLGDAYRLVWSFSLPAAVGLGFTADRWMPALFGGSYREGGPLLALVAARLPWLLASGVAQAGLLACRREGWGLRLTLVQLAIAAVLIPIGVFSGGPTGAGWAALGVEMFGAVVGWALLARLGVAPGWPSQTGRALLGCLGLVAACRVTRGAPLAVVTLAGAFGYAAAWRGAGRLFPRESDTRGVPA